MIGNTGYEVINAIHIGDKEVITAANMSAPDGKYYLKAEYRSNGLIGEYSNMSYSSSYLSVMDEFIESITRQLASLRVKLRETDYLPGPITAKDCYQSDYSENIDGKVVAVKAESLRPEYRRGDIQLVLVVGGNGANANPPWQGSILQASE